MKLSPELAEIRDTLNSSIRSEEYIHDDILALYYDMVDEGIRYAAEPIEKALGLLESALDELREASNRALKWDSEEESEEE